MHDLFLTSIRITARRRIRSAAKGAAGSCHATDTRRHRRGLQRAKVPLCALLVYCKPCREDALVKVSGAQGCDGTIESLHSALNLLHAGNLASIQLNQRRHGWYCLHG